MQSGRLVSVSISLFKNRSPIRRLSSLSAMSTTREYDLVVFGATGFTGQYVAEEVARIAETENVTWAVAGRSIEKMKTILENVEKATGMIILNQFTCSSIYT